MEWKCCLVRIKVLVKLYSTIFCAHIGKLISLTAYKLLQPEERSLSVFPWFSRLSHVIFINGARGSILRIRKRWPPRSSITLTRGPVKHGGSLFDVRRQCPWTSYGRGARKSVRWEKERLTGLASVSRKAENRNTSWSGLQESGGMCDTGESPPFLSGQFSLSSWFFPFFFFFFFVIVVLFFLCWVDAIGSPSLAISPPSSFLGRRALGTRSWSDAICIIPVSPPSRSAAQLLAGI